VTTPALIVAPALLARTTNAGRTTPKTNSTRLAGDDRYQLHDGTFNDSQPDIRKREVLSEASRSPTIFNSISRPKALLHYTTPLPLSFP
jgi:hypothetical protein